MAFDDTHSIFVANAARVQWINALTWDPQVFGAVHAALDTADTELSTPNRVGC